MKSLTKYEHELIIEALEHSFSKTDRVGFAAKRAHLERLLGKLYVNYIISVGQSKIDIPFSGRLISYKELNIN